MTWWRIQAELITKQELNGKNEEETTAVSRAEKPHRVEVGEPSTYSINKHLAMYDVKTRKKAYLGHFDKKWVLSPKSTLLSYNYNLSRNNYHCWRELAHWIGLSPWCMKHISCQFNQKKFSLPVLMPLHLLTHQSGRPVLTNGRPQNKL